MPTLLVDLFPIEKDLEQRFPDLPSPWVNAGESFKKNTDYWILSLESPILQIWTTTSKEKKVLCLLQ